MRRTALIVVGALALVLAAAGLALAQGQASEFGPVTAADIAKESLPASPLLYGAYAFVWVALVVYVFLLWRRIDRVERELAEVTNKLAGRR